MCRIVILLFLVLTYSRHYQDLGLSGCKRHDSAFNHISVVVRALGRAARGSACRATHVVVMPITMLRVVWAQIGHAKGGAAGVFNAVIDARESTVSSIL